MASRPPPTACKNSQGCCTSSVNSPAGPNRLKHFGVRHAAGLEVRLSSDDAERDVDLPSFKTRDNIVGWAAFTGPNSLKCLYETMRSGSLDRLARPDGLIEVFDRIEAEGAKLFKSPVRLGVGGRRYRGGIVRCNQLELVG